MGGVIRCSRLPIVIPDAMGGRASGVNSMFIGASIRWASSKAASPRVVRHANGRARRRHRHNPGGADPASAVSEAVQNRGAGRADGAGLPPGRDGARAVVAGDVTLDDGAELFELAGEEMVGADDDAVVDLDVALMHELVNELVHRLQRH
jgi:hypothetical protein